MLDGNGSKLPSKGGAAKAPNQVDLCAKAANKAARLHKENARLKAELAAAVDECRSLRIKVDRAEAHAAVARSTALAESARERCRLEIENLSLKARLKPRQPQQPLSHSPVFYLPLDTSAHAVRDAVASVDLGLVA